MFQAKKKHHFIFRDLKNFGESDVLQINIVYKENSRRRSAVVGWDYNWLGLQLVNQGKRGRDKATVTGGQIDPNNLADACYMLRYNMFNRHQQLLGVSFQMADAVGQLQFRQCKSM